jgi:hypothetical protein
LGSARMSHLPLHPTELTEGHSVEGKLELPTCRPKP